MRSYLIIFISILNTTVSSAQNTLVSLHMNKEPLYKVLEAIETQSCYRFIYDAHTVDINTLVTVYAHNEHVFDVLNRLFTDSDIACTFINNQIILSRKETVSLFRQHVKPVKGTVTDAGGEPVIGANILIKGTSQGTVSDIYGNFQLNVPLDSTLSITYIGFLPQEITYTGQNQLQIGLREDVLSLDEVVITALGIKHKEASLPYATQLIGNSLFTSGREQHLINMLAGKTPGVQINRSSSGLGGSVKVSIRGNRSVSGNNQPLYVIDGIPLLNSSNEQPASAIGGTANAPNRDGGDGISNLNPEDIESIRILKGASASALYGSQAANGIILITTKKGTANQHTVTFSSNVTIDRVMDIPSLQNDFGRTDAERSSWGSPIQTPVYDHVKHFFQTGIAVNHSLLITAGSETAQNYFSYANTHARGIIEHNKFNKHNFTFRETAGLFNNRLSLDGNVNLITQKKDNKPTSGGIYMNPLVGLYTFPRGMSILPYKTGYEQYDGERALPAQQWPFTVSDYDQNPYWLVNRAGSEDKRARIIAYVAAGLKITDWLSIQGRGSMDYIDDKFVQKIYATTSPGIAGQNGRYIDYSYREKQLYGDLIATFNRQWKTYSLHAVIGAGVSDNQTNSLRLDSNTASLYYPNVFTVSNINMSTNAYIEEQIDARRQLQSIFATFQLGYLESLFLNITARNDWSSTLAYTKSERKGFFYPSFGLAWTVNQMMPMPEAVSHAKFRISWSKVGNDLPLFVSNPVSHINAGGSIQSNDTAPFNDLKPEMSHSFEAGTEWRLLNHRLFFDVTFYTTNTKNQLFVLPSSLGAAYKYYCVNAGNIQNRGVELMSGIVPVLTAGFSWESSINFSANKNLIRKLHPQLSTFIYGDEGFSSSYSMRLKEGGSFGDIYGKAFKRDANNQIEYGRNGIPLSSGEGNTEKVGNSNPDCMLGWSNALAYKDISFYFLIDAHLGGKVLSQTQAMLDQYGVSKNTGEARKNGHVNLEGNLITNIKDFYEQTGGRNGITEYYMYDATNIRLREISLSYSLPAKWIRKSALFHEVQLAVTGRNLFFFYQKAPFDPNAVLSTNNSNQGIDIFGMPSTRSFGFNLRVSL
ncbi:MAG: SusC/RagA family TonB-linked outer membrane protein [Tannerella sp.]|jgi:TonB-linked SusC/RagA family outer membrane protein|nr:SusC/RagA family TonB-linked outer membrane protein [Tannerella sp.]